MSRVGILTYHREPNPGSVLQAYCTHKLIQSLAGGRPTEILDYRAVRTELRYLRRVLRKGWPPVDQNRAAKLRTLRRFLSDHAALSPVRVSDRNAARVLSRNGYDVLVVGSDTVWEVNRKEHAPLAPNLYQLPEVPSRRKIAFAVSADTSEPGLLNEQRRRVLSRCLADFDIVLTRDSFTDRFVRELGVPDQRLGYLPDPTFLWDFGQFVGPPPDLESPIAGVGVDDLALRRSLTATLTGMGFNVLNLLGEPTPGQHRLPEPFSIGRFLGAHAACDLMITDRFHGSIFTLLFGRAPLVLVELPRKYPEPDSKGRDLLSRLGAEGNVWRYTGERVTPSTLHGFLEHWHSLTTDPRTHLTELRHDAAQQLDRVRSLIAGP